jgi:hypothetical protein
MIPTHRLVAALSLILLIFIAPAHPQRDDSRFDFYARGPYRENVPRPQRILRYDAGEFHTNYALMERVIEGIAQAAPDRVRVTNIGETNEHRMMHLVIISAPENIARLDQIKGNIARLADPRAVTPGEAEHIINETPVIVWLSYAIHGNESASFEAMMQVVYQLAASNEPATLNILKNCVALVNVCANPDGHERFVTWYNSNAVGDPNPLASEHREPWSIYGRLNRYRFDLNRDNIASTQVETRNMQRAYLEWNPQVLVDHHGQPSQFFFPPAALPINPNLPVEQTSRWLSIFGRANAAQFDARQWDFYVRDVFDLFYPGYWDSWPSLNGAIGMTYETDGGGYKGINWRREDDTIVTLRSAIAKHFVASMTTLETAAQNRAARLKDYFEFRQSAIEEGRRGPVRRIVLVPGRDPGRALELVEVLLRAGIEVSVARAGFRVARAHDYLGTNAVGPRDIPAGAYVIDLAQPQKRLAKALLEPNTEQDGAFVREQLARFARNQRRGENAPKEDYSFYDVTSWSLPLAFGVEAYWTEEAPAIAATPLARPMAEDGPNGAGGNGGASRPALAPPGGVTGRAAVAYIIPYERNGAAALACRLQREGFRVTVATRPLNAAGRDWPRGTMVVRVSRNSDELHERIARLAAETGVEVTAVNTGFTDSGETGVGSETIVALKRPRIIVIGDEPVNQLSYGAIWWLFDRYGVEFTPMTIDALKRAELDRYNVIIMPDGSPDRYFAAFGKNGVELLRGWCERGGTLVCIKGAAVFAALKDVNLTSARLIGSKDDDQKSGAGGEGEPKEESEEEEDQPDKEKKASAKDETGAARKGRRAKGTAAGQQNVDQEQTEKMEGAPPDLPPIASPSARPGKVPEAVPGAIMRATVDRTTPLTYGYEEATLPVLVESAYFFRPSKEGTNAVVFKADDSKPLRLSGFIWPDNTERLLKGAAYVIEEPTGRGHVVLYAEDPNFRGFWNSTTRLFFNSFLFQPAF